MSDSSGRLSPAGDGCAHLLTSHASQGGLLLAGDWVQDRRGLASPCTVTPAALLCGHQGYCQRDLEHIKSGSGGKSQGHGGPSVFLLNSAVEVKGLDEKWIDSTGQQVVVHLLTTAGICFLQLWYHL